MKSKKTDNSLETFRLVGLDEGGVRGAPDHRRLVCNIDGGGKLVIWSREGSRHNIDAVLRAGMPCSVECEWIPPRPDFEQKYGHTNWVSWNSELYVANERDREKVEINPAFAKALKLMEAGKQHLFITGKAGTGKSTLLNHYQAKTRQTPVILAPTGIAALNVRGQTIHRFFGFGIDVTPEKIQQNRIRPRDPELYKQLKSIIVDEVSMLRADLLDCMDGFLRKYGPRPNTLFGGVQMVFVGDLYQLPPVVTGDLADAFSSYYETPYFFSAKALAGEQLEIVELEKVYRQKDATFINLLNRIRDGSADAADRTHLNERVDPEFEPGDDASLVYLTTTNRNADRINARNLAELPGNRLVSHAEYGEEFSRDYFPTSLELAYKQGAQVMMVNNDPEGRWVNGDMGRIESVMRRQEYDECLRVRLRTRNRVVEVKRHTWELVRFTHRNGRIVSEPAGSFRQLPFRLAWAVTIHKSQGQTFDRVVVDLESGAFAAGQIYVALSRCTSLEGLVLKQPLNQDSVHVDPRITQFLAEGRAPQRNESVLADYDATDPADSLVTLTIIAFDEGGVSGNPDRRRLVCNLEGGGRLAIWGRISSRNNIDTVLNAGLPCTVECASTPPSPTFADKFRHTHWLAPDAHLRVVRGSSQSPPF